jgi:3-oxoacyl-[acyl-carrier protein] reductase
MQKLEEKIVLVTGGAQGIGAAIAALFAQEGATVVIGDMNEEVGRMTQMGISRSIPQEAKGRAVFQTLNITDQMSVDSFVTNAILMFGRIDILINNAGITKDKTFLKMPREDFMRVYDVNVFGLVDMTRAVVPHMVNQGSGVILNAASIVAENGNIGQTNYASTKAAVKIFTKSLAKELGRKGIRVNAVAPGFTDTPMVAAMTEEAKAATKALIPLGRLGRPEEIAEAYLYLATATYVTGMTLSIDGGLVV